MVHCSCPIFFRDGRLYRAVAFLGLAQKMPMTSCVFMLELSRFSVEMLFPYSVDDGTALMVEQIIQSKLKAIKTMSYK